MCNPDRVVHVEDLISALHAAYPDIHDAPEHVVDEIEQLLWDHQGLTGQDRSIRC